MGFDPYEDNPIVDLYAFGKHIKIAPQNANSEIENNDFRIIISWERKLKKRSKEH